MLLRLTRLPTDSLDAYVAALARWPEVRRVLVIPPQALIDDKLDEQAARAAERARAAESR